MVTVRGHRPAPGRPSVIQAHLPETLNRWPVTRRKGMIHEAGQWPGVSQVLEPLRMPGVYRVEARSGGRMWILSNAIRVVEG